MRFKASIEKHQIFILPSFGWINERWYYGYPVYSVAFAWLHLRCKVQFGLKKWRAEDGK